MPKVRPFLVFSVCLKSVGNADSLPDRFPTEILTHIDVNRPEKQKRTPEISTPETDCSVLPPLVVRRPVKELRFRGLTQQDAWCMFMVSGGWVMISIVYQRGHVLHSPQGLFFQL